MPLLEKGFPHFDYGFLNYKNDKPSEAIQRSDALLRQPHRLIQSSTVHVAGRSGIATIGTINEMKMHLPRADHAGEHGGA